MEEAAKFFKTLLNADIPKIGIENPLPHKYALKRIGKRYDQMIQPWEFGDDASKATCLWLKGLPPLLALRSKGILLKKHYENQTASGQNRLPPSPDRAKLRSLTYPGIAEAMAEQWG
jgi:hypothetical protein